MDATLIALWLVSAAITASVMAQKRRNALVGLVVGLLLGPLAVLLALASGRGHSKRCPFCRESIDRDAIRCPRCQSVLNDPVSSAVSSGQLEQESESTYGDTARGGRERSSAVTRTLPAVVGVAFAIIAVYIVVSLINAGMQASRTVVALESRSAEARASGAVAALRLLSADCESSDTTILVRCTGAVRNTGAAPLRDVRVVVTWYSDTGVPQSSDSGFLDFDPVPPGQTSTWKVLGRLRDQTKWSVGFATARGERIAHVDDRAASPTATPK